MAGAEDTMAEDYPIGPVTAVAADTTLSATDWDSRFMRIALEIATWSKDRSRKIGCVVVGPKNEIRSTGYNGFPRKLDDAVEYRHERPMKYKWTEHAERNAIYNAARIGVALEGCRMYVPWFPCMDCARAIVQSGIIELVCVEPDLSDPQWGADFAEVPALLRESGVAVKWWISRATT
jgi:dCMP deaminase